jgi:hypothetical protein
LLVHPALPSLDSSRPELVLHNVVGARARAKKINLLRYGKCKANTPHQHDTPGAWILVGPN